MPSIVPLLTMLSLDVTRAMVALGFGLNFDTDAAAAGKPRFTSLPAYAPLAIVGCTGASVPIVITTAYPHGVSNRGVGGLSCIITGATGNTAANNVSADSTDRTVGLPQGVIAVATGPTTLALYGQDQNQSSPTYGSATPVPLVGNGTWTGGGTVTPALTDGSILIGRENTRENSAPPRIVAVPTGAEWGPKSNALVNPRIRNAERLEQIQQRSVRTRINAIEFDVWGAATPPNPAGDFTACEVIADALEDSAWLIYGQPHEPTRGRWADQKERETQFIKSGHLFIMTMTLRTPVLDNAFAFVPAGTTFSTTVQSATPEVAATFAGPVVNPS
jgi:hypothetical protein